MIGERPTGPELHDAFRAAAAKAGVPLKQFVAPICSSTPDNFIAQLGRALRPVQSTINRVRALIAGEPIPAPRESPFKGHYGKRERQPTNDVRISGEVIAARRCLTERAHAERQPGETLAAAVRRLGGVTGEINL